MQTDWTIAKSKKVRRKAAKAQRRLEERRAAGLEVEEEVKIPLQKQTIDLPTEGKESVDARDQLRKAMRQERRGAIKERNYLQTL